MTRNLYEDLQSSRSSCIPSSTEGSEALPFYSISISFSARGSEALPSHSTCLKQECKDTFTTRAIPQQLQEAPKAVQQNIQQADQIEDNVSSRWTIWSQVSGSYLGHRFSYHFDHLRDLLDHFYAFFLLGDKLTALHLICCYLLRRIFHSKHSNEDSWFRASKILQGLYQILDFWLSTEAILFFAIMWSYRLLKQIRCPYYQGGFSLARQIAFYSIIVTWIGFGVIVWYDVDILSRYDDDVDWRSLSLLFLLRSLVLKLMGQQDTIAEGEAGQPFDLNF